MKTEELGRLADMSLREFTALADAQEVIADDVTARSQAVIADCARMRTAQRAPMTVAEAVELAAYMARVPESVVTCKRMREVVRVLAFVVKGF